MHRLARLLCLFLVIGGAAGGASASAAVTGTADDPRMDGRSTAKFGAPPSRDITRVTSTSYDGGLWTTTVDLSAPPPADDDATIQASLYAARDGKCLAAGDVDRLAAVVAGVASAHQRWTVSPPGGRGASKDDEAKRAGAEGAVQTLLVRSPKLAGVDAFCVEVMLLADHAVVDQLDAPVLLHEGPPPPVPQNTGLLQLDLADGAASPVVAGNGRVAVRFLATDRGYAGRATLLVGGRQVAARRFSGETGSAPSLRFKLRAGVVRELKRRGSLAGTLRILAAGSGESSRTTDVPVTLRRAR